MNKPPRRILLLTDVFPCDSYSGALMSGQLCRFLLEIKQQLFCACVRNPAIKDQTDDYLINQIPCINFIKPSENTSDDKAEFDEKIEIISQQIVDYIRDKEIDTVWCPLQGEALLKIYSFIQKNVKNIKFITQIWDPFEWVIHDLGYSEDAKKSLLKIFDVVMKKSDSILAASKPMATYYQKKYSIKSYPIFTSYQIPEKVEHHHQKDQFTIVISGQTYAIVGINSLLQALDNMNWKINNKKVVIEYFGSKPKPFEEYQKHVHINGYVSQAELIAAQNNADLLYCSYFFNHKVLDVVRKQSYPSKIITYIPSQVPILIHSKPDSPVYQDFKKYHCGYLLDTTDIEEVKTKLIEIVSDKKTHRKKLITNSIKLFNKNFTKEENSKRLFKAFGVTGRPIGYKVLEVNNVDVFGHIWNGYDIASHLNNHTNNLAVQICNDKLSDDLFVQKLYTDQIDRDLEYEFIKFEDNILSTQLCLSAATKALETKKVFNNSDLVHYHLIHNAKISLFSLIRLCNQKPSVISVHDPWLFTGHCVHYYDCGGWKTGCKNCPHLDYFFPLKKDNSHELWKLKKYVYDRLDVDFVVSTEYMYDLFKTSPLTKDKRVHLIPFGIEIDKYNTISQKDARKKYHIPNDNIVLFHRAQTNFKGTNYLVTALKNLNTTKTITVIACGEKGHFDSLKEKYQIVDLGVVRDDDLAYAYNACDVFVMPSTGESFGMMAVEAMSCSKPVICFNNTALPSVIFSPTCGIAVDNLNTDQLMMAIKHLAENDEERISRGKLARKIVIENYDIKNYFQKMNKLYQEVLKRKRKHFKIESTIITETDSVINLKKQLNRLTNKLLPKQCDEYQKLYYNISRRPKNKIIEWSNLSVQLLLDEYNHKAPDIYREFRNSNYTDSRIHKKIAKYAGITKNLILHDRKQIVPLIKKRLKRNSK